MFIWLIVLVADPYIADKAKTTSSSTSKELDCSDGSSGGGGGGGGGTGPVVSNGTSTLFFTCEDVDYCPELSHYVCSPTSGQVESEDDVSFIEYIKADEFKVYEPVWNNTSVHYPFTKGFNIAFQRLGVFEQDGQYVLAPHYEEDDVYMKVSLITSTNGGVDETVTDLAFRNCTLSDFDTELEELLTSAGKLPQTYV